MSIWEFVEKIVREREERRIDSKRDKRREGVKDRERDRGEGKMKRRDEKGNLQKLKITGELKATKKFEYLTI